MEFTPLVVPEFTFNMGIHVTGLCHPVRGTLRTLIPTVVLVAFLKCEVL